VTATFRAAMARHGKPEAVRTDRGGAFVAYTKDGDFGRVLEAELVDHIVGRSYSPRGGGKVESAIGTLKRELLWECFHFEDRGEAERRLAAFVEDYNHRRAHMGIDGPWCPPTASLDAQTRYWPASTASREAGSPRSPVTATRLDPSRRRSRPPAARLWRCCAWSSTTA
jgi:transposase InsO family protein